ncbi:MAG TPA: transglycosylase family protein [Actinocrinis sp.]|nr:transglycosylase family protein [Actinocrinis sp.]
MSLSFRRTSMSTRTSSYTRRIAATAAIAGAGIALPLLAAGSASAASSSTWDAVASCESGGDWSINTGNGFYGGLQFTESTWLAYGGGQYAQYANDATEGQQITVAEAVLASQGVGAWPVCGPQAGLSQGGSSPDVSTSGSSGSSGSSSSSSGSSTGGGSTGSSSSSATTSGSSSGSGSSSSSSGNGSTSTGRHAKPHHKASTAPAAATGTYTVVAGDTLSGIAQKEGVASWRTLYSENTSVIGGNADLILPGQVLTLG